jgi:hypothetical protein
VGPKHNINPGWINSVDKFGGLHLKE